MTSLILSHVTRDENEGSEKATCVPRERLLGGGSFTWKAMRHSSLPVFDTWGREASMAAVKGLALSRQRTEWDFGFYSERYLCRGMTPAWKCQELLNVWVLLYGWACWHQSLKSICFVYKRAGALLKTNFLKIFSGKVQKYLCWIFIALVCCHLSVLLHFFKVWNIA